MLPQLLAATALALGPAFPSHGIDAATPSRTAAPRAELDRPWCGDERTTDDTADQVDNGAFRYHAVLAEPAGTPGRLVDVAPAIQNDAIDASKLLELRYGRAIRLDLGTRCGAQYLDISVLRMRQGPAELRAAAAQPNGTLQAVYDELAGGGWPVTMPGSKSAPLRHANYVVWLDGPAPEGACGQGTLYSDPRRSVDNRNNMGGS